MSEKHILTRKELEPMGCDTPFCAHDHSVLFMHSVCHTGAGSEVSYEKATGILTIKCVRCKRLIIQLLVAA